MLAGLLAGSDLYAREPRFDHVERISAEDGLSHSTVWAIHQDARGFLWFGTQDGLNRYDGYELRVFRNDPEDPHSLSDNDVLGLFEDRRANLWLRTRTGLERFDPRSERFYRYRLDPAEDGPRTSDEVLDFFEDEEGTVWVATSEGLHRYLAGEDAFESLRHDPSDPGSLPPGEVYVVTGDSEGRLWVGTAGGLARFEGSWRSLSHGAVYDVEVDSAGAVWIATAAGLDRLDRESGELEHMSYAPGDSRNLAEDTVYLIHEDRRGELWILGTGGLALLDRPSDRFTRFHHFRGEEASLDTGSLSAFTEDSEGDLWIGTLSGGLCRLDRAAGAFVRYRNDPSDPASLASNSILDLHVDDTGILWIGSYSGINKYVRRREQFETYRSTPKLGGLSSDNIWAVYEDSAGELWVGTYDRGLNRLGRDRATAVRYGHDPSGAGLSHPTVTAIREVAGDDGLWIGTWGGLDRLDRASGRFDHYRHDPEDPRSLSHDRVFGLYEDRSGGLWVATRAGVDRFDRVEGTFESFQHEATDPGSLVPGPVYGILEDRSGALWIGTLAGGLSRLDRESGRSTNYFHDPSDPKSLPANGIAALHEDERGNLWVGTYHGGLARLDPARREFRHYRRREGLPNDSVLGILEDGRGRLWLSTNQGLSRFDPRAGTFRNYDAADGLQGNVFSSGSSFRSPSGEMFFGGVTGLTAFFPAEIEDDPSRPPVVLTDFRLFYESVPIGRLDDGSPLEVPITMTSELVLDHRQYVFSLEFAALQFAAPRKSRYAYRLEPFDQDWIETDAGRRSAQYSNLDSGDYVFRVRATNQDGVWNDEEARLSIRVLPAPWKTWWACTLYALAFAGALGAFVRLQQKRLGRERSINARLREVDRLKDEFLANTSHELRTPLYGITGIAESLIDGAHGELPARVRSNLDMIVSSGRRLTGLVNDILDLSKLTEKSLDLVKRPVDVRALTDVVLTLSRPLVGSKDLELVNSVDAGLPPAEADENRLQQILINLVGNAVKFTEAGTVEVAAVAEDGLVTVRVADTGVGIAEEKLERIFEAFEQADASTEREFGGTGLGLAVTKQLVALHGGSLWVESKPGEGSSFFFTLPVSTEEVREERSSSLEGWVVQSTRPAEAPAEPPLVLTSEKSGKGKERDPEARRILIVDDEPVLRQVLTNYLAPAGYDLEQASSGAEALRLLEPYDPDLVLLDVMMPRMSGYEVCRRIRRHRTIDEMPIIFLTAKNQVADLVSAFSEGASDYLTKPISRKELLARVRTHLDLLRLSRNRRDQVEVLSGLLPICSKCKSIRDDRGYWEEIENFIDAHSEARFTHGICPNCARELYPDIRFEDEA